LEEGTLVFRPVKGIKLREGVYKLEGFDIYNPDDEKWEFLPGAIVSTEERLLNEEVCLVAIREIDKVQ
jgi:hypothetical protein